ncbi:MAG: type II toxin-antitoxin system VapC family toxin [Betaproteobacteria bacterium]|nr:type II toxin-antitoxin system VapC family toxin [Betaproteobacteria bacterium]
MILVDTCGWIEAIAGTALGRHYQPLLRRPRDLIVPTIVQFELYKWLARTLGDAAADEIIAATQQSEIRPLTTEIALAAAELALKHRLSAADAIVYATARRFQAEFITSDGHFKDLPDVRYLAK